MTFPILPTMMGVEELPKESLHVLAVLCVFDIVNHIAKPIDTFSVCSSQCQG